MKLINYILIIFIGFSVCNALGKVDGGFIPQEQPVDEATKSNLLSVFGKVSLHFVANHGQFPEDVVYYAKSEGATVYCTDQGLTFGFAEGSISLKFSECENSVFAKPEARGELKGKVNYFIGNNPASWQTDIPSFSEVVYPQVYPGIDLVYNGDRQRLKYTFYLQPNSDPNQIQMTYDGIESLCVDDATGELVIQTPWGEIRDAVPIACQEIEGVRKEIDISFCLMDEKSVGFTLGNYDPNFILILDPGYSTYLGGNDGEFGSGLAVDSSGNVYVTGHTYSSDFPTNNLQGNHGGSDAFVTKLSSSGNTLIYSTYLGGSDSDSGNDIAVDSSGNAYVTGQTVSFDFPTQNPFQDSKAGYNDAFVAKLDNNGSALIYSTYLGGSGEDLSNGIAVDSFGNAYVTGQTGSSDFPIQNPFQSSYASGNVFVTKFSGSGTPIYSTYLGGSGGDLGFGIAVDSSGNAYVTGFTGSSDFPTQNPFQGSKAGVWDAFVTKLSDSGNTLAYSTYLGGSGNDYGYDIAVDSSGNAYITGYTWSSDFPTQNPFQGSKAGGDWDAFVTKLSSNGNTLSYSTYLGGNSRDTGRGIAVDSWGNAYVTGQTDSSDFPIQNPFQSSYAGASDAFVTKLENNGSTLIYSTYLGGSGGDSSDGITVDSLGNTYVTGDTYSSNFPTQNSFQGSNAGVSDAFVTSFLPNGSLSETPYSGPIWYVSTTGSNNNDGRKEHPFATIQRGIDAASDGDTVLVADGTYIGDGNKNLDFKGKAITVTSENGAENCIIDCEKNGRGFYFHSGETAESVVSGFTIQKSRERGGIYCENGSSPVIQNNIISANIGGGINCTNSSPTILNNTISENSVAGGGGGISCTNSSPTIQNNKITGNSSKHGGGIHCCCNSSLTIQNNEITGNRAVGADGGGGIYCSGSPTTIINNTITGNYASRGGGIYCSTSSLTITNTILWNDSPQEILFYDSFIIVSYSDVQGGWPGEGNIDADPLFVDPGNNDYHLQAGSPCIDAGDSDSASPKDPDGTRADIGALYYDQGSAITTLEKFSGDNQNGFIGTKLPKPLVVLVKDQSDEPMLDVQVDFAVTQGDGSVNPTQAITDSEGKASTELTLGQTAGLNEVTATVDGLSVIFSATGIEYGKMVLIPAGEFSMGDHHDAGGSNEKPVHIVYLDAYYIDAYEVTNDQYATFLNEYGKNVDAKGHELLGIGSSYCSSYCLIEKVGSTYQPKAGYENHPVIMVSWYGAAAYAQFYGKRLPTEAQWEKAARGGLVGQKYPNGDSITHDDANYEGTGGRDIWDGTAPVGSFPPNGYGLYDMDGNVAEKCADEYDDEYYSQSPKDNPLGPGTPVFFVNDDFITVTKHCAIRTGSYNKDTYRMRCGARKGLLPSDFDYYVGFRCAQNYIETPVATTLEKVSGDNQSGGVGGVLPDPLVVRVLDQNSEAIEDVTVNFEPSEGASVNPVQATTNEDGQAQTVLTLGAQLGEYNVTVSVEGLEPVVFTATAIGGATLVVDVGEDKTIPHPQNGGETQIGGNPTASGGTPPYRYSWTPTAGLDDATIANPTATPTATTTYTITVTDSSEPQEEASDSVTVNVDNTPPEAPDIQISSTPGNTVTISGATITITGSGEMDASIQSATLDKIQGGYIRDSTDVKEYVSMSNGNISGSFDLGELADVDEIRLVIILRDDVLNESEPGRSNKLSVDKENPKVMFQQPGNGSYFNTIPIIISGTATDDTGVIRVEVDTGEGFVVVEGTNEWHYSFEPTTFGEYTVMARAFDGVGRSSEKATCTFKHFSYLPTAAIAYPLDGAELTGKVDILGSAGDVDDDYSDFSYTLEYELENAEGVSSGEGFVEITTVEGAPVQDDKLGVWDISGLVEGVYTLRLTVKTGDETVGVTRNNLMVKGNIPPVKLKINFARGWNLISFPGDVIEPSSPDGFIGTEIINILNANYKTPDAFELGEGYWALAIQNTEKEVKLIPQGIYTRELSRGWNLIGSAYGEACIPEGVIQLNRWNAKTKENESASRIEWGIGYWALVLKDGEITVDGTKPCIPTAPPLRKSNIPPLWVLPIQFMDADSTTTTHLSIGIHPDATDGFDSRFDVALPPPPPGGELLKAALLLDGDFDTWFRYASHSTGATQSKDLPLRLTKQIQPLSQTGAAEFLLQVENPEGDAVLSWDAKQIPDDWSLSLIDLKKQIDMAQQSTYSLPKGVRQIVLVLKQRTKQRLPDSTDLLQSYPNPFNPETWIPYQIAQDAQVTIEIFNITGELIRRIELGSQTAGWYVTKDRAAYWNGRNKADEAVASGIYFYKLRAGNYSALRKMLVVK